MHDLSRLGVLSALLRNGATAGFEAEEELHGLLPSRLGKVRQVRRAGRDAGRPDLAADPATWTN
jgi:hypothetical protein